jgi:hypothetical protein
MSNLNDIFDLPMTEQKEAPKKERKKIVMSDEKKAAMLERLAKGRETRANNLLAKKGQQKTEGLKETIKEPVKEIKEPVKEIKEPVKEIKVDKSEDERKAFINMMAPKKQTEKFERPKKKVYNEEVKVESVKVEPVKVEPVKVEPVKVEPVKVSVTKVVAPPRIIEPPKVVEPVIIRTFKRPMWG